MSKSEVTVSTQEAQVGGSSSFLKRVLSSKSFHSIFGISVSVLLLAWVFSEIEIERVKEPLRNAHYWVLLPALGVMLVHFFCRAVRWKYLLPSGDRTSLMQRFDAVIVGNFANFVLPLRAGEFVRPYMLSKTSDISFAEGFSSIITERFFDLAGAIITFAIILPYFPAVPDWVSTSAWALGSVAVAILFFILFVSLAPKKTLAIFDRILGSRDGVVIQKARNFLIDFIASARILADPLRLLTVLVMTCLVWVSNYVLYFVFLFLIDSTQSFLLGTTLATVIALAVAAPSAPGFIGVYQTACLAGFALFGLPEEQAFVYSVISHVFQYVIFIGYGMRCLSKAQLRLSELRDRSEESVESI